MTFLVRQIVGLVIAVAIVVVVWAWTPPSEFKDRLAARDPVGAAETLNPIRLLNP